MKKINLSGIPVMRVLFLIIVFFVSAAGFSQTLDSLREGRVCKIVLYNGFEAEGTINSSSADTVHFQTDIILFKIPVNAIKFVLNPGFKVSELEEDLTIREVIAEPVSVTDTTAECDVYLSGGSVLKEVQLIESTDTSLYAVKEGRNKEIPYSKIRKVVFKSPAPFGHGYLYGSAIGFAIGFFPLAFSKGGGHPDFSGIGTGFLFGIVCSVPAGLIGGIIGVISSSDIVYLFDKGDNAAKIKRIKYIIKKHPC